MNNTVLFLMRLEHMIYAYRYKPKWLGSFTYNYLQEYTYSCD